MSGSTGPTNGVARGWLCLALVAALVVGLGSVARDVLAFRYPSDEPLVVVTGSSTVRYWPTSSESFPHSHVLNTAFAGSTMDSLLAQYPGRIRRYAPDLVVIGSGDNDLAFGRSPDHVTSATRELITRIHHDLPTAGVVIVAAKPSVRRWALRPRFEELNADLQRLAEQSTNVSFVDVWDPLLDQDGDVRPELYKSDGLHLNARGYEIYSNALAAAKVN